MIPAFLPFEFRLGFVITEINKLTEISKTRKGTSYKDEEVDIHLL